MTESLVLVNWLSDLCHIRLNAPTRGNALSTALLDALNVAMDACTEKGVRGVVIDGAGKHFCTGFDLADLERETDDSLLARFVRIELLLQRIARAPFRVAAIAHGRAIGAGADLFAACQARVAVDGSSFAFPGAKGFGLVLGSRRLSAHVGAHRALRWIESAESVSAAEALSAGLATTVVSAPPTDPLSVWDMGTGDGQVRKRLLYSTVLGNADMDDSRDLAALVRSAAAPGLAKRIAAYVALQGQRKPVVATN